MDGTDAELVARGRQSNRVSSARATLGRGQVDPRRAKCEKKDRDVNPERQKYKERVIQLSRSSRGVTRRKTKDGHFLDCVVPLADAEVVFVPTEDEPFVHGFSER